MGTIFIFSDMEFDQANVKACNTSSSYGGIVSSRVSGRYVVGRQPKEEKTNYQSVKVSISGYAVAHHPLWLPLRDSDTASPPRSLVACYS